MALPVDFYREVDLVKEAVIPKQEGVVLSSVAKEASVSSANESKPGAAKAMTMVGDNELVDGISVRYPGYLATFFHNMRTKMITTVDAVTNKVDKTSSIFYKHETRITSAISNLHSDPREELLPGFTYIAVASMAGSIFAKNKGILSRVTAPFVLGTICFGYVLPSTFSNTARLLHDIEAESFPSLAAKQDALFLKTRQVGCNAFRALNSGTNAVSSSVNKMQHNIKEWTGLNVE